MQSFVAVNALLHFVAEAADQTLNGPSRGVSERANGVAFDLSGELVEHVDLREVCVSDLDALQDVDHP